MVWLSKQLSRHSSVWQGGHLEGIPSTLLSHSPGPWQSFGHRQYYALVNPKNRPI